ncbi:MAG: hypothetical protein ACHQZR_02360 [Candidatus Limnocylindrales bacterium]
MTTERDFDRLARAWLELSPNEAPDRTIQAVLRAVRTTPQVRRPGRWLLWRFPVMTRPALAAGALIVIVAVLGAAVLLGRGLSSNVGGPTISPSASTSAAPSPTAIAAGGPLQAPLRHRWIGGTRTVSGLDAGAGTSIIFDASSVQMNQSNSDGHPVMTATASAVDSQTLRLDTTAADFGCSRGDVGLYGWSLTADGRALTITARTDDCATRRAAVPGTWQLVACRDPKTSCLGDVTAGTYGSQYIAPRLKATDTWVPVYGAVTYTVPDGWANSSDWPSTLGLTPSNLYDALPTGSDEGSESILVVAQATPMSQPSDPCAAPSGQADGTVARTVAGEIMWLRHVRGLITTAPASITIDGHAGQWLDVRYDPSRETACKGGPGGAVGYLMPGVGVDNTAQRQRVIVLDLGSGDILAVVINSDTTAPFAAFAAQAMPIVSSLTFK